MGSVYDQRHWALRPDNLIIICWLTWKSRAHLSLFKLYISEFCPLIFDRVEFWEVRKFFLSVKAWIDFTVCSIRFINIPQLYYTVSCSIELFFIAAAESNRVRDSKNYDERKTTTSVLATINIISQVLLV